MTRRQTGFVLDSFLLFLVALFIYVLGRRAGKKRADETGAYTIGGPPYPDGGVLLRMDGRVVGETQLMDKEPKGYDFSYKATGVEFTDAKLLRENVLRKGTFKESITTGLGGDTSLDGGRHVPWTEDEDFRRHVRDMLRIFERDKPRREEEDGYYDERE